MTIQYGELTLVYEEINQDILTSLWSWFIHDTESSFEISKFIFLFDDGEIMDMDKNTSNRLNYNFHYTYTTYRYSRKLPSWFQKNIEDKSNSKHNPIYFIRKKQKQQQEYEYEYEYKDEEQEQQQESISSFLFHKHYHMYPTYDKNKIVSSKYNCIYYCYENGGESDVFSIVAIKSISTMPRFYFSYDTQKFTKQEIIYIIHVLITQFGVKKLK
jgi:hypothetical protein